MRTLKRFLEKYRGIYSYRKRTSCFTMKHNMQGVHYTSHYEAPLRHIQWEEHKVLTLNQNCLLFHTSVHVKYIMLLRDHEIIISKNRNSSSAMTFVIQRKSQWMSQWLVCSTWKMNSCFKIWNLMYVRNHNPNQPKEAVQSHINRILYSKNQEDFFLIIILWYAKYLWLYFHINLVFDFEKCVCCTAILN